MKKRLPLFVAAICSTALMAQEDVGNTNIEIHTVEERWYASPWVWIAGAAVFIMLLVVLTKEKKQGER